MKQRIYLIVCCVFIFLSGCSGTSTPKETSPKSKKLIINQQGQIDHQIQHETPRTTLIKPNIKPKGIIPTRLQIPAIHLDTQVEPVGILSNGQMGVPTSFSTVGVLNPWTMPGEEGNAVIAGHFDHYTGPAIFYNLRKLKPGDKVMVSDKTGAKLTFIVKEVQAFKTQDAPLERIFGNSQKVQLNLITCAGKFNKKTRHHAKRLVVFTELVK